MEGLKYLRHSRGTIDVCVALVVVGVVYMYPARRGTRRR